MYDRGVHTPIGRQPVSSHSLAGGSQPITQKNNQRRKGVLIFITPLVLIAVILAIAWATGRSPASGAPTAVIQQSAPSHAWVEIPESAVSRQNTPEHPYTINMTALTNAKLQELRDTAASQLRYNMADR